MARDGGQGAGNAARGGARRGRVLNASGPAESAAGRTWVPAPPASHSLQAPCAARIVSVDPAEGLPDCGKPRLAPRGHRTEGSIMGSRRMGLSSRLLSGAAISVALLVGGCAT